jgi:hypothetical protein
VRRAAWLRAPPGWALAGPRLRRVAELPGSRVRGRAVVDPLAGWAGWRPGRSRHADRRLGPPPVPGARRPERAPPGQAAPWPLTAQVLAPPVPGAGTVPRPRAAGADGRASAPPGRASRGRVVVSRPAGPARGRRERAPRERAGPGPWAGVARRPEGRQRRGGLQVVVPPRGEAEPGMAAGLGVRRVGWGGMALGGGTRSRGASGGAAAGTVAKGQGLGQASRESRALAGSPAAPEVRSRVQRRLAPSPRGQRRVPRRRGPRRRGVPGVGSLGVNGGPLGWTGSGPRALARPLGRFAVGTPRVGAGAARRLGPTVIGRWQRPQPWSRPRSLPQVYALRDGSRAGGTARPARGLRQRATAHRWLPVPPVGGRPARDPWGRCPGGPDPWPHAWSTAPPVREGSRVRGRVGPRAGGRPNGAEVRPLDDPAIWACRPGCPRARPGSRGRGWGRRAGLAGWRWRDRSGAHAISRSMRRSQEGRPHRMEWNRPSPAPATWTRPDGWTRALPRQAGPAARQVSPPLQPAP